jgi:hypothetical protein
MSSWIGRLDLAMSMLETFGNIAYGLTNRFDRPYLGFSKRRVFRGHDHTIRFEIWSVCTWLKLSDVDLKYLTKLLEINIMIIWSKL